MAAVTTAFALSVVATLAWAWTGGVDQLGLPFGPCPATPLCRRPPGCSPPPEPGVPVVPTRKPSSAPATPSVPAQRT